jgi:hypothetical protein
MLLPSSYVLFAYFSVVILIMGAAAGAAAGIAAAALLKNGLSRVGWDAALGAVGLFGALAFFAVMPWPRNTVAIVLKGKVIGSSTTNRYQHEWPVGWTTAVLLPVAHQTYRRWRRRSSN